MSNMDKTSGGTLDGAGDEIIRNLLVEGVEGIKFVSEADDLPDAENGVRTLDDTYNGYYFLDFVADPATLDPNGVPMVGFHGGAGGYIHTGGTVAFQSSGTGFYADNFYGHAPGAQLFDLQADNTTRFYVTDSAFYDPDELGLGPIANLGVVDGFKVQAFKSVNFEDFVSGLTLTGNPDKSFFDTCPFREVSGSNATVVTGDANYTVDILKFIGSYVKNVQSDTTVVDLSGSGLPNEYFKYLNVDHDSTFTKDQVFTGFSKSDVGVVVANSFPLADSVVRGELYADPAQTPSTVTISSADTYTSLNVPSLADNPERVSKVSDGKISYDSKRDTTVQLQFNASFYGANGDIYRFAILHNGHVHEAHTSSTEARGTQSNVSIFVGGQELAQPGDTFSIEVKNQDNANDVTILDYSFDVFGI